MTEQLVADTPATPVPTTGSQRHERRGMVTCPISLTLTLQAPRLTSVR